VVAEDVGEQGQKDIQNHQAERTDALDRADMTVFRDMTFLAAGPVG
jgi:hypothetical protein